MLSNSYFYHKLTRKYVIAFGNMFNNITLKRLSSSGNEIERVKVPIVYGPKDKYHTRLRSDPDLNRPIQVVLPRMSFELRGIQYDAQRKQNSLLRVSKESNPVRAKSQYMGVPYTLTFELQIYARNVDDGTHIVEQILPYFAPDYTVSVNLIPEIGFIRDLPITLNSVSNDIQYEGNFESVRYVYWTLNFTMKVDYYGAITEPKIIRKVLANIYNDPSIQSGNIVRINTDSGNSGTFNVGDIVYQGDTYQTATAFGTIYAWDVNTGKLVITGAQGQFLTNTFVKATSTNASYRLASFEVTPLKLVEIKIEPDPIDAQPGEDYGFTETISEWPFLPKSNTFINYTDINADDEIITADNLSLTVDNE